jgi:hypothetical protein
MGRFLTESPWNEDLVLKAIQKHNIDKLCKLSKKTEKPIDVIIDDTISTKTKSRSKAKNTISRCQYHHSHTENKRVYGHIIRQYYFTMRKNSIALLYVPV